jgi:hypothetical protein
VRPLVLNKTNFVTIEKQYGKTSNWPGKQIILVARTVEFGGGVTLGTRVKFPPKKKEPPKKPDGDLDDAIPF